MRALYDFWSLALPIAFIAFIITTMLCGCSGDRSMVSVEKRTGTEAGKQTSLVITKEERERTQVEAPDIVGPAINAAFSAAKGDLVGSFGDLLKPLSEAIAKKPALTLDDIKSASAPKPVAFGMDGQELATAALMAAWGTERTLAARAKRKAAQK
jgi:hypothetical protein